MSPSCRTARSEIAPYLRFAPAKRQRNARLQRAAIVNMQACLRDYALVLTLALAAAGGGASAAVLDVGGGREFARIEDALARAGEGDTILVHPNADNAPYAATALLVRTPRLTIRAAAAEIVLDGAGFDYSGRGNVPRAIVQFDPQACGSTFDGFTLRNARNASFNGAGVRINQANDVTITNCMIRGNDMGVMSNGSAADGTGARQLIVRCVITENGNLDNAGYNHNLYLGGSGVVVRDCDISRSVAGHNLKSRAHVTRVESCRIRDSANRELDIVDAAGDTDIPGSDAFIIDCEITKAPDCEGNRGVIHFGRDGAASRDGTLWISNTVIRTPFISPVVALSSDGGLNIHGATIDDAGARQNGEVVSRRNPASRVIGCGNSFPEKFRALPELCQGCSHGALSLWRAKSLWNERASRYNSATISFTAARSARTRSESSPCLALRANIMPSKYASLFAGQRASGLLPRRRLKASNCARSLRRRRAPQRARRRASLGRGRSWRQSPQNPTI